MLSKPQSLDMVSSLFETPLNWTISCVYIFSCGFEQRVAWFPDPAMLRFTTAFSQGARGPGETKDLLGTRRLYSHCPINMLETRFVYGNNDALLEISSAHNFGACTNVSCLLNIICKISAYDFSRFNWHW